LHYSASRGKNVSHFYKHIIITPKSKS